MMKEIEIYIDSSDVEEIRILRNKNPSIKGITTNPTIVKKAGITDYKNFINDICQEFSNIPVSIEVLGDDEETIINQAIKLAGMYDNIFVKIPIVNSKGEGNFDIIEEVTSQGIKVNVTAVFTKRQIKQINLALNKNIPSIISIFAGRIADSYRNPKKYIKYALKTVNSNCKVLWASPRSVKCVFDAEKCGCDIITITPDIYKKFQLRGKNLDEFSKETSEMFYRDAVEAGYKL